MGRSVLKRPRIKGKVNVRELGKNSRKGENRVVYFTVTGSLSHEELLIILTHTPRKLTTTILLVDKNLNPKLNSYQI